MMEASRKPAPIGFYNCTGYDLHTHHRSWTPNRVIWALNVWNDRRELERSLPRVRPYVDEIVAVDGAYEGMGNEGLSSDGTRELLAEAGALIIDAPQLPQTVKRGLYFREAREGDLILHLDADELLAGGEHLRGTLPLFDVGWITYTADIYQRPQNIPRLFRYRPGLEYRKRHHWLYCGPDLFCTNQQGGPNLIHRRLPAISFHNNRGRNRHHRRQQAAWLHRDMQMRQEKAAAPDKRVVGHEPLRIMQTGPFDPGAVCYRLHTGINTTSPHTSLLATGTEEWTQVPRQFDYMEDERLLQRVAGEADVAHHHVNYAAPMPPARWTVIHHHGTEYRLRHDYFNDMDSQRADLRLVSNFELMQYGEGLHWLPNPMPVAEYRLLRSEQAPTEPHPFTIAHSPTKMKHKGTGLLIEAVDLVKARGVDVALSLIHKVPISEALTIKAQADAVFDSFWLGMQCSGLEGAAMGLPVLAGDSDVKAAYEERLGYCPYTYAEDVTMLADQIERLATDPEYYATEAATTHDYCVRYHDQANVVARYLDLLDEAVSWRDNLPLGTP